MNSNPPPPNEKSNGFKKIAKFGCGSIVGFFVFICIFGVILDKQKAKKETAVAKNELTFAEKMNSPEEHFRKQVMRSMELPSNVSIFSITKATEEGITASFEFKDYGLKTQGELEILTQKIADIMSSGDQKNLSLSVNGYYQVYRDNQKFPTLEGLLPIGVCLYDWSSGKATFKPANTDKLISPDSAR